MRLELTPEAKHDLRRIAAYIRQDKPEAAKRLITEILDRLEILPFFPERGRQGRVEGTREAVLAGTPYIAIYQVMTDALVILRVLHGARQWPPI